jgi:hypothetical protein
MCAQSFRKLLISTIREKVLKVDSGDLFLFYLCGRGISKVEIVGWVRSVRVRQKKIVYYVDDGSSSCMRCTKFLGAMDTVSHASFKPGDVVSVKGVLALSETNEEAYGYSLQISCMEVVDDPNVEAFHWLTCINLYQTEYSQPLRNVASKVTGGTTCSELS